jgi:hypothetical protein
MHDIHVADFVAAAAILVAVATYVLTARREKALHRAELVHSYSIYRYRLRTIRI